MSIACKSYGIPQHSRKCIRLLASLVLGQQLCTFKDGLQSLDNNVSPFCEGVFHGFESDICVFIFIWAVDLTKPISFDSVDT